MLPKTPERERSIDSLRRRADEIRAEIFKNLTPVAARAGRAASEPAEHARLRRAAVHRRRRAARRSALRRRPRHRRPASRSTRDEPVAFLGHQKGRDTKQKIFRNFGYARPGGLSQGAARAADGAEVLAPGRRLHRHARRRTPASSRRSAASPRRSPLNLREMMMIEVPIIVIVCGEGGSGGALGIAIGDRVMMQEFSVYSVIPPEGCAAILWRDPAKKVEAATALKITAPDMVGARPRRRHHPRAARRRPQRLRNGHGAGRPGAVGVAGRGLGADGRRASRSALRQVPAHGRGRHVLHRRRNESRAALEPSPLR